MTASLTARDARQIAMDLGKAELGVLESQTLNVLDEMQAAIFQRLDSTWDSDRFEYRVKDAVQLIFSVRLALNPASWPEWRHGQEMQTNATAALKKRMPSRSPGQVIWPYPDITAALFASAELSNDWDHDQEELRTAANTYLATFWDHSPSLERIFISALAYTEAQAFARNQTAPKSFMALINYKKPTDKPLIGPMEKSARWKLARSLVWRFVAALIPALFVGSKFGIELGVPTYLLFSVLYLIQAAIVLKFNPDPQARTLELCCEMANASKLASKLPQPPTSTRLLLEATTAKGAVWPQELWQFVLRAEDRCRWALDPKTAF